MKSLISVRFLRLCAVVFSFVLSSVSGFSQALDSIGGTTLELEISGSTHANSGKYLLLPRGDQMTVYNVSVYGMPDSAGFFSYGRTDYYIGQIGFWNHSGGHFSFTTTNSGTYYFGLQGRPDNEYGKFKVYNGSAPASLENKIIQVETNAGRFTFGGQGPYKIITTSSTAYSVQNVAGATVHSGTYYYARTNRSSGIFKFQDNVHGSGIVLLTYSGNDRGVSVVRKGTGTNQVFQTGAFVVSPLLPPVFTSEPTSQSVPVGTATTFSASVTGTGPFTYQWYKDGNLIGGATGPSYTIPSVQLWDAGNYYVVVTSAVGSVTSVSGTLTPLCSYSLSHNSMSIDFRGGTRSLTIFAAGTCSWTASTATSWISITTPTAGQGNSGLSFLVQPNNSDTPRMGSLQIAGKTLVVAQAPRFAKPDIAGKTIRIDYDDSNFFLLLALSSGTNRTAQFTTYDETAVVQTVDYNYSVTSSSNATISTANEVIFLKFDTAKTGTLLVTNLAGDLTTGTFVMEPTLPDFNEDVHGDIVMQGAAGGFAAWHMRSTNFVGVRLLRDGIAPNGGGRGFGAADFNKDGHTDLVIQDAAGRLLVWFMQGTNRIGGMTLRGGVAAPEWRAFSVADVNGDGHPDILFQNYNDRRLSAWLFNGTTFISGLAIRNGQAPTVGWSAVGAADLNRDLQTDILLQNTAGQISAWFLNGGQFVSVEFLRDGIANTKWKPVGIGDIDEDGYSDILVQNSSNQVAAWLFKGKQFQRSVLLRDGRAAGSGWKVVAPN